MQFDVVLANRPRNHTPGASSRDECLRFCLSYGEPCRRLSSLSEPQLLRRVIEVLKPDIFRDSAFLRGGSYSAYYAKKAHYIVLQDVKGVPVVIQYGDENFDEFVPVAEKVLDSVQWTGN